MRIRGYDTTRAQRGWVCDVTYMVTTARQFSDEEVTVRGRGRWMWLAMWRGWLAARRDSAAAAARPGERSARGWSP